MKWSWQGHQFFRKRTEVLITSNAHYTYNVRCGSTYIQYGASKCGLLFLDCTGTAYFYRFGKNGSRERIQETRHFLQPTTTQWTSRIQRSLSLLIKCSDVEQTPIKESQNCKTPDIMAARIIYDGLVLTSIDVKPVEGTERTVRFSGSIAGRADDDTATFIEKVRQINDSDEDGKRLFEAETVTVARAKEIINGDLEGGDGKPLFCVHGFNTQPGWRTHGGSEQLNEGRSSTRANSRSCLLFDQMKEDLRITCVITARTPQELARPSRRSSVMLTPFPESRCFATLWHGKLCSQTCCS